MTSNPASRTSLTFAAPADLSVGHVTVGNQTGLVRNWVATPGTKTLKLPDAQPGIYTAEIAPLGQRARAFVFEVKAGVANTIDAPLYSDLAAGGTAMAFSGVEDRTAAMAAVQRLWSGKDKPSAPTTSMASAEARAWIETPTDAAGNPKILSIGLSQAAPPGQHVSWAPYGGPNPTLEFEENGLNLILAPTAAPFKRLRLSMALEGERVERLMVPLFCGGVRVAFRPSPLTTIDVALRVTPLDPERRALTQALLTGTSEEVRAVRGDVLRGGVTERFIEGEDADPLAALAAALLAIRFPDAFEGATGWTPGLEKTCGWIPDAHVIHARHILVSASDAPEDRHRAARDALKALLAAVRLGPPYFAYANQLIGELLTGLVSARHLVPKVAKKAETALRGQQVALPLQRSAGAAFSWLAAERRKKDGSQLRPIRPSHAELDENCTRLVFRGRVSREQVSLLPTAATPARPKAETPAEKPSGPSLDGSSALKLGPTRTATLPPAPAEGRPVTVSDDPNKGRFGGHSEFGGYVLSAGFTQLPDEDWVEIHLRVDADRSLPPSYSDVVVFFLHPTFNPSRASVALRGHAATLTVRAWGGFTVGAWLPQRNVELECDLATLPSAPRTIRDL